VNEEAQLFSEAFFPDPGLPTRMSETQNYNFYDAMVDYKMEKYEVALQKWENVKEGIGADTLQFYQGMALLNLGKNEEAKSKLSEVPQSSDFKNLADWYLVSLYIKSGKFSEAKALMGKIPSNINSNYKAIQSFLETK
jgi:thioredoxin-like negative regulator of GroEL